MNHNKRQLWAILSVAAAAYVWFYLTKKRRDPYSAGMCIGSGGYDISFSDSTSPAPAKNSTQFGVESPKPAPDESKMPLPPAPPRPKKPAVKIGSLPACPNWVWHILLALAAAALIHTAIYLATQAPPAPPPDLEATE